MPISVEQQNRVLRIQVDAYKAAINWKMAELRRWEAGTDRAKFEQATKDAVGWKEVLDRWNSQISELRGQIQTEDRCPGCSVTDDFHWVNTPANPKQQK